MRLLNTIWPTKKVLVKLFFDDILCVVALQILKTGLFGNQGGKIEGTEIHR